MVSWLRVYTVHICTRIQNPFLVFKHHLGGRRRKCDQKYLWFALMVMFLCLSNMKRPRRLSIEIKMPQSNIFVVVSCYLSTEMRERIINCKRYGFWASIQSTGIKFTCFLFAHKNVNKRKLYGSDKISLIHLDMFTFKTNVAVSS